MVQIVGWMGSGIIKERQELRMAIRYLAGAPG